MATPRANITADLLTWARESAGYEVEDAAKKAGTKPDRLLQWERGETKPTINQLRKLAHVYRRPMAIFFARQRPAEPTPIGDFRMVTGDVSPEFPTKLRFLIREMRVRQSWLSEYRETMEYEPIEWVGSNSPSDSVEHVAAAIRTTLNYNDSFLTEARTADDALDTWINAIEGLGVIVSQAGDIDPTDGRGFCLTDRYAPFIFINSKDSKGARIFTLLHETAHLFLGVDGVSNMLAPPRARTEDQRIEVFCNAVAGEVLVPAAQFEIAWDASNDKNEIRQAIRRIARQFRVSDHVVARRALNARRITQKFYDTLTKEYIDAWKASRARLEQSDGGPPFALVRAKRLGRAFTDSVLQAHRDGNITTRDVGTLLGVKQARVPDVAAAAGASYTGDRRSA